MSVALAAVLAFGVVVAWARLWTWQRAGAAKASKTRLAILIATQPVLAILLYLGLQPPVGGGGARHVVVATRGAVAGAGVVALPEAGAAEGAKRAPDLATALRRAGDVRSVRIIGSGLEPRDREALDGVAVQFDPPQLARGIVRVGAPAWVMAGDRFEIAVRAEAPAGAEVRLIDPAGRVVDRQTPDARGEAVLSGTARTAGAVLFTVKLGTIDTVKVPLWTRAPAVVRLLILSGAPGPEIKALRRWATDAGLAVEVRAALGGGATLGGAVRVEPGALARTDILVLDDRAWTMLGSDGRSVVRTALRGGMGLVLRATGPLPPAVRQDWRTFGFGLQGDGADHVVSLPPAAPDDAALAARRGPGSADVPLAFAGDRAAVPELTRTGYGVTGAAIMRDKGGAMLSAWRPAGQGRVALTLVQDSFALTTSGHGDRYAEWWSALLSAVARPGDGAPPSISDRPRAGVRAVACGVKAGDRLITPRARAVELQPERGCAAFWPRVAGWYRLGERPVHVGAADADPAMQARERRDATLRLVRGESALSQATPSHIWQSRWFWLAAWMIAAASTWWFERRRKQH